MVVTVDGRDWSGQGHLVSGNDDDRDGFVLLCELDPVFLLRFDSEGDGDGVPVTVHDLKDGGRRFSLTEYRGNGHRQLSDRSLVVAVAIHGVTMHAGGRSGRKLPLGAWSARPLPASDSHCAFHRPRGRDQHPWQTSCANRLLRERRGAVACRGRVTVAVTLCGGVDRQLMVLDVLVSLVVAEILDDDTVAMVSDTRLLYDFESQTERFDEARTRQIYQAALPKIAILGRDLAVGFAGSSLARAAEALVAMRNLDAVDLLERLQEFNEVDFVVAALNPTRLWKVADGQIEDRLSPRRAWAGDGDSYKVFRELETRAYPAEFDRQQRLLASMQTLVHNIRPDTVGGYVIHLTTRPSGFRFVPAPATIAPSHLLGDRRRDAGGNLHVRIVFPPGLDPTMTELMQLVGKDPTRGALALYVPQARTAWLFTQNRPWEAITLRGDSSTEIIRAAAALNQRLSSCGCDNDDH